MSRRILSAYLAFSIVVLASIVTWAAVRTVHVRNANADALQLEIDSLKQELVSGFLSDGAFLARTVSPVVRAFSSRAPDVRAFVLHDGSEIHYLIARDGSYLSVTPANGATGDGSAAEPTIGSARARENGSLVGVPEYRYAALREALLSNRMVLPEGSVQTLDVIAVVLKRSELYPIVREVLIALLSFLLITSIVIVIVPYVDGTVSTTTMVRPSVMPSVSAGPAVGEARSTLHTSSADPAGEVLPDLEAVSEVELSSDSSVSKREAAPLAESVPAPAEPSAKRESDAPARTNSLGMDLPTARATQSSIGGSEAGMKTGLYSPVTDLGWEQYLEERLSTELKRAASFDQDLVLLIFSVPNLTKTDAYFHEFSETVREYFTFRDLCFEFGDDGIAVVVPNIDLDQGIERCEDFSRAIRNSPIFTKGGHQLIAGLSSRNGRLIDGQRLITEASTALIRAMDDDFGIIAFRVDPAKYREYIASKS